MMCQALIATKGDQPIAYKHAWHSSAHIGVDTGLCTVLMDEGLSA
jgi:hypothetical protein